MNCKLFGQLPQDLPDTRQQGSIKRKRAVIVKHEMLQRETGASGYVNTKHLGLFLPHCYRFAVLFFKKLPA